MWRRWRVISTGGLRLSLKSEKRFRQASSDSTVGCTKSVTHSSSLKSIIFDKIRVNGPLTVAEYMKLVSGTYYSSVAFNEDDSSVGIGGDFVTSPEISQMFGEMVGVWCAYETWKLGHGGAWQMVELGPGTGSLMFDLLNTLKQLRIIRDADEHPLSVHLVEISDALAAKQERVLCSQESSVSSESGGIDAAEHQEAMDSGEQTFFNRKMSRFGPSVSWYKDLDDVPRQFCVILAHEFFDALPIHKFQRTRDGKWREVYIDADLDRGRLKFVLAPSESIAQRTYLTKDLLDGLAEDADHVEVSPQSMYLLKCMIDRITEEGGAVLIVDYGRDDGKMGDTLRGFRKHRIIENILDEEPGSFDITADVNFGYLKKWANGEACCFGPITQGEFLKNLGIEFRFKRLMEKVKSDEERNCLRKSYEMLINEDQMGAKFKVLAIFPKVLEPYLALRPPAGFAPPA